jgi:DNA repair protein RadC
MTYQIISERKLRHKVKITKPDDAYAVIKRYAKAKQEYFILLTLDGAHCVISVSIISIGIVNRTIIHPREVFAKAISDRASAVIICHNHPSGELFPSDEDKDVTEKINEAGKVLGIPFLDHILFTSKGYISLFQSGEFPKAT